MLTALAFLRPQDVARGFVLSVLRLEQILVMLQTNCWPTYVGRFRLSVPRNNSMFSIELWNMFHRTDAELPRANSVKGWHRSF